jgi:hypothetical protein
MAQNEVVLVLGFEGLTEMKMYIVVFWVVTPCSLVDGYQCFGGTFLPEDGDLQALHFNHEKWRQHVSPER